MWDTQNNANTAACQHQLSTYPGATNAASGLTKLFVFSANLSPVTFLAFLHRCCLRGEFERALHGLDHFGLEIQDVVLECQLQLRSTNATDLSLVQCF